MGRGNEPSADLEWSDFKVLLALGRTGSIAGAARALTVDGSTVSRRLAAAEQALGAVLIVRGGRTFSFTEEGKAAVAAAEAMEAAVVEALAAVRRARSGLQGIVRVACPPVAIAFLAQFHARVAERHPGLGVDLIAGRAPVDLAKGEADISIRSLRQDDLDLVVAHRFELGSAVYAAPSYLAAHGQPASHDAVAGHKLVRYTDAFLNLPAFRWLERYADPASPSVRVDSIDLARSMIAAGSGIGVLYCLAGDATEGIVRVFDEPIDQMTIGIVYHTSMQGSARVRAVLDLLTAYHEAHRNELSGRRT
jgi:DNA-binding transcriptional LysR family regulator